MVQILLLRFFLPVFFCLFQIAHAQRFDNRGWFYLSHTHKITSRTSFFGEAQLRSWDRLAYVTATLLRGGVNYQFSKIHHAGVGYTFKGDREATEGAKGYDYLNENRLYEQYVLQTGIRSTEATLRVRLEQRFVRQNGRRLFSQRSRFFFSAQVPVSTNAGFSRGWYLMLQNEIFLNLQHQERVNHSLFDQNRLYAAYGYRFSRQVEAELGYYLWLQREEELEWRNVYQLKITTDL